MKFQIYGAVIAAALCVFGSGCDKNGNANVKVDASVSTDKSNDSMKTASEKISDAAKTTGEKIKVESKKVGEKVSDAAEKAWDATKEEARKANDAIKERTSRNTTNVVIETKTTNNP